MLSYAVEKSSREEEDGEEKKNRTTRHSVFVYYKNKVFVIDVIKL